MSKADISSTPILGRRAVLAGIMAAAAVPAAAALPAAATTVDPLSVAGRHAALARAEEIVSLLRISYVREGWQIDEAAAQRTLAFFRRYAEDGSEPDDERKVALDFLHSHGQSIDWVLCGDHGGMICKLAGDSDRAAIMADAELISDWSISMQWPTGNGMISIGPSIEWRWRAGEASRYREGTARPSANGSKLRGPIYVLRSG
jgi:hypothetical protein